MTRPVNPNISIPAAFAVDGQKTDFTAEKLQDGFDPVDPDVLAGDNLNKFIDDTYKGLNYSIDGVTDLYDVTDDLKDLSNLSATGQAVLDGKASTDLSNLTSTGEAHFANPSLSNLNTTGESRLHALKSYEDAGELLTDAEGLADVTAYAHSTFDSTKFTKVGSPTVTDDGIAIDLGGTNHVTLNDTSGLDFTEPWEISFSVNFSKYNSINICMSFNSNGSCGFRTSPIANTESCKMEMWSYSSNTSGTNLWGGTLETYQYLAAGIEYDFKFTYDGINKYRTYFKKATDKDFVLYKEATSNTTFTASNDIKLGGVLSNNGTYNLKNICITVNGVPVFSGNQTGSDSYTINGSTVTIPYTLSKTGSKIVDSAYRTDVASVYSAFGIAPYYTLSDSDFTLPQGELYGMMQKSAYYYLPDWNNGITLQSSSTTLITDYTVPANGYMVCNCGSVAGSNLNCIINGTYWFTPAGSTGNGAGTVTILVNKGDTYSETLSTGATNPLHTVYFIPTRGV